MQNLAAHVYGDLFREIAIGHGDGHLGNVAHLAGKIIRHRVDVVGDVLPGSGHALDRRLPAKLAFRAHFARNAADFPREGVELIDHCVNGVLYLQNFAAHVSSNLFGEIAARHGGGHFRDVAYLAREV